jgi:hypothetical protein
VLALVLFRRLAEEEASSSDDDDCGPSARRIYPTPTPATTTFSVASSSSATAGTSHDGTRGRLDGSFDVVVASGRGGKAKPMNIPSDDVSAGASNSSTMLPI